LVLQPPQHWAAAAVHIRGDANLVFRVGLCCSQGYRIQADAVYMDSVVKIAFDNSNLEATSAAMILKDLLTKHTSHIENMVPDLLRAAHQLRTEDGHISSSGLRRAP
jgi:hypothetical protein